MVAKTQQNKARPGSKRGNGAGARSVSVRLSQIESKLATQVLNATKFVQNSSTAAGIVNSTPSVVTLNVLAEGTGENNVRIGDRAHFKMLRLRALFASSSTLTATTMIRLLVVKETTTLGSALGVSQYFNTASPTTQSLRNYTSRDNNRFTTYFDESRGLGLLSSPLATAFQNFSFPNLQLFTMDIPLNFTTDYSRGSAGTVADIDTNGLSLILIAETSTASAVNVYYEWAMEYTN